MILEGLGRIYTPLGTIRLNGVTRLIVSPWAAMGTDVLLITTGLATFALSRNTILQVLGMAGTIWGTLALGVEGLKILQGDDGVVAEIVRE